MSGAQSPHSCMHDCSPPFLPKNRALTIASIVVFTACIVMALVFVYLRRFCVPPASCQREHGPQTLVDLSKTNEAVMNTLRVVKYEKKQAEESNNVIDSSLCLNEFE
ncbi:hypothetical protein KP509_35G023100 [Ceratopteris richardii]|nr:hypothetical protein KP509_35G023100 [Ceratopteris richardii]